MMAIVGAVFRRLGGLPDAVYHLEGWLKEAGFVSVRTESRKLFYGGEEGAAFLNDADAAHQGLKTPVLKFGGLGLVGSEEEYDALVVATKKELASTKDAGVNQYMIYAQKPMV